MNTRSPKVLYLVNLESQRIAKLDNIFVSSLHLTNFTCTIKQKKMRLFQKSHQGLVTRQIDTSSGAPNKRQNLLLYAWQTLFTEENWALLTWEMLSENRNQLTVVASNQSKVPRQSSPSYLWWKVLSVEDPRFDEEDIILEGAVWNIAICIKLMIDTGPAIKVVVLQSFSPRIGHHWLLFI